MKDNTLWQLGLTRSRATPPSRKQCASRYSSLDDFPALRRSPYRQAAMDSDVRDAMLVASSKLSFLLKPNEGLNQPPSPNACRRWYAGLRGLLKPRGLNA